MPNWMNNIIRVESRKHDNQELVVDFLKKYLTTIDDHTFFDFNKVIPAPDKDLEYRPREERLKNPQPDIAWRRKHWGVKWNSFGNQCFDYDRILNSSSDLGAIHIFFMTAWHPPYPIIKKVILDNPDLDIGWDYYSYESDYGGSIGYENYKEEYIWDCQYKFKFDKEEYLKKE